MTGRPADELTTEDGRHAEKVRRAAALMAAWPTFTTNPDHRTA